MSMCARALNTAVEGRRVIGGGGVLPNKWQHHEGHLPKKPDVAASGTHELHNLPEMTAAKISSFNLFICGILFLCVCVLRP